MPLSNADRQRRHRERLKAKATGHAGAVLTPEQVSDRDAVMADPIYPVSDGPARDQMPTFMGWNRYEWASGPDPLIDYFGMRAAVDAWRREIDEMCVTGGLPPEFDRGELYRTWKAESERRIEAYKARQAERDRTPPRRRRVM